MNDDGAEVIRRALLITVQVYEQGYDDAIGPAVRGDAEAMRALLLGLGWQVEPVVGGDGGAVTASDIKRSVVELLRSAKPDEELLVYYSGHGRRRAGVDYMIPSDALADEPDPFDSMVALRYFEGLRAKSDARSVTFVVDACRDGEEIGDDVPLWKPAEGKAISFLFAVPAGERAGTTGKASVLTAALASVVPRLGSRSRLEAVKDALQAEVTRLADTNGRPPQRITSTSNVSGASAPFPLFGAGRPADTTDVWSRLFAATDASWAGPRIAELLPGLDEIENAAPDLVDVPGAQIWAEPGLQGRLARALRLVADRAGLDDDEVPLLLVCTAVLEAAFRRAELHLMHDDRAPRRASLLGTAPRLREAVERENDPTGPVRAWVTHLAAPCHAVVTERQALQGDLLRALYLVPDAPQPGAEANRSAERLADSVATVFDGAYSRAELLDLQWWSSGRKVRVSGRRLATALEIVWGIALDTRVCSTGFGAQLLDRDPARVPELLASLDDVRWSVAGNVLSLSLACDDAILDHELRRMVATLSEHLLRATQPGFELHGSQAPVAAVPDGLEPDPDSYQLPHVSFEVSTSELYGLLMGSNFYGDRMLAVREVYQNAVDACRYRKHRDDVRGVPSPDPTIGFELRERDGRLLLDCVDDGVGMSLHELRDAFAKVGGRFQDLPEYLEERASEAGSVPPFQPISQFGIGVLSYFMIADRVELWTRRRKAARSSEFHPGLHVDITDGADLFRIRPDPPPDLMPSSTGTRLRLHLKPDIDGDTVLQALVESVRAPRVTVRWTDERPGTAPEPRVWSAGLLYHGDGSPREDCLAFPDLGVYLHPGEGEFLINGIGVDSSWPWPSPTPLGSPLMPSNGRPLGFTLSLDGRVRPSLSVDRRTLHHFDIGVARRLLLAALDDRLCDWPHAGRCLGDLFAGDVEAGRRAFAVLANTTVTVMISAPDPDRILHAEIIPATNGVWLERCVGVLSRAWMGHQAEMREQYDLRPANDLFGAHVLEWQRRLILGGPGTGHLDGLPAFDDRLAVAVVTLGTGVIMTADLARAAQFLEVTIGAAAVYVWAIRILDQPGRIELPGSVAFRRPDAPVARPAGDVAIGNDLARSGILAESVTASVSEMARALWSRNHYGTNPFLRRWDDVVARVPWQVMLESPSRAESLAGRTETLAALRELAEVLDVDPARLDQIALPEPGEVSTQASAPPSSDDEPPATLGTGARHALSRDLDDVAPYYTELVPALNVVSGAHHAGEPVTDVADELLANGYRFLPENPSWPALEEVARLLPAVLSDELSVTRDATGRLEIARGIRELDDLCRLVGPEAAFDAARVLARNDMAGPLTVSMATMARPSMAELARHSDLLSDVEHAHLWTLTQVALDGAYTFGEAYRLVLRYRAFFATWALPPELPPELAHERPDPTLPSLVERDARQVPSTTAVILRALAHSARTGAPLTGLIAAIRPVADAAGLDVDRLDRVAAAVPGAVTFNDLLVLGTAQFDPPIRELREVVALCRPFARDDQALQDRARRWLALDATILGL